jgi:hypothetical protein
MPRATPSTSSSNALASPQHDEHDLLGRWQSSPVGRTAAAIHGLINEVDELRRLSALPAAFAAMDAGGDDLELAHRQLGQLLLRISARRADQRVAS